jgi:hypothetical protein
MARLAVGTVPSKISYVYSAQHNVSPGCAWDCDAKTPTIAVYPAFPIDPDNENGIIRAKQWAKDQNKQWDFSKKEWVETICDVSTDTFDNLPIKNIKLVCLESRGEGGRAYKVIIDDKYYVDMREDVMVDVILQEGVAPGGILGGSFIWAKLGHQLRLVRVGSELHKQLEDSNFKKTLPKICKTDLEIGGVYKTRKGDRGVFIGYVNTISYSDPNNFSFSKKTIKKAMLFYMPRHDENLNNVLSPDSNETYRFKICNSHTYIEKIGSLKIDKDYVSIIKQKSMTDMKNDILEFTGHKKPKNNWGRIDANILASNVCYRSTNLNISKYGEPMPEPFDIKKYLVFS